MKFKPLLSLLLVLSMDFCSVGRPRLIPAPAGQAGPSSSSPPPLESRATGNATPRPLPLNPGPEWHRAPFSQEGVASWYGPDFHGKQTSNGEVYDQSKLTAAHQTLPFHTLVEVENLENGRKILVRINDRGPFLKNRIIDLSHRGAQEIGMLENGTAQVRLRVVRPILDQVSQAPVYKVGHFLQLGAFSDQANAAFLLERLRMAMPEETFRISREGGLFKVVTLNTDDRESLRVLEEKLSQRGFAFFVKESTGENPAP